MGAGVTGVSGASTSVCIEWCVFVSVAIAVVKCGVCTYVCMCEVNMCGGMCMCVW